MVYGVLHGYWVLHGLVDRLPNVDGTPKYCQNALEVAVGSRVAIVRNVNPDLTGFGRSGS